MSIPQAIQQELVDLGVNYTSLNLPHPMATFAIAEHLGDQASLFLRMVMLKDDNQERLLLLPYVDLLDVKVVEDLFDGDITCVAQPPSNLFSARKAPSMPPITSLLNAELMIDPLLLEMPKVIIESGDPETLIVLDNTGIKQLFSQIETAHFAVGPERLFTGRDSETDSPQLDHSFTSTRLKQRIDETYDLPAMPEIAQDIMRLRVDPSADASKLAEIVCRDPSLAAQVISWASSPYYGYQGKIDSVETAIARVLGFELVMNLALGISIGKSLKVPVEGPLGLKAFWRQSIYCASLAEKLCHAMPLKQRPERGLVYLSGLLHNFGHLLLGHLFLPQFDLVNLMLLANPQVSVEDIEFYVLGVTHEQIGGWLMQNWHMPDELIVAVERHHQEEFWSKHAVYSNLVLVANRLLKRIDIGDSLESEIPQTTLELLSIDSEVSEAALLDIREEADALDQMANQLVA